MLYFPYSDLQTIDSKSLWLYISNHFALVLDVTTGGYVCDCVGLNIVCCLLSLFADKAWMDVRVLMHQNSVRKARMVI